jgi:antirestriction protein ArdC
VGSSEYYATLFHEIIHSTGNEKRLKRFTSEDKNQTLFGSDSYSKEELVAEIGASFLCHQNGIENKSTKDNSVAYLQNWLKMLKDDHKLIIFAAAQAEKAVKFIKGEK